jgi:hypothetical protein
MTTITVYRDRAGEAWARRADGDFWIVAEATGDPISSIGRSLDSVEADYGPLDRSEIIVQPAAQRAFDALSLVQQRNLLNAVFDCLEYDSEGQPGSEWSSDTLQAIGEAFNRYGITFTTPE